MRIKIVGTTDKLILKEMAVINQGFFDDWEFVDNDADIEFELASKNLDRYAYLKMYLEFLEQRFGKQQPWGLLNHMRPNKLVHSLKKRGASNDEIADELKRTYLVHDDKIDLLLQVANHQLAVIPDLYELENEVSIYIGIPFCPTRCAYCTFAAYAYVPNKKWVAPFLDALLNEVKTIGSYLKENRIKVTSIYLGGGTPTMLEAAEMESLLTAIYAHIAPAERLREITVEAGRPDSLTREKLELLKKFNVNRMSVNPQTFNQGTLDKIGRHHSVEDVIRKFEIAKAVGIPNINMDLIVGLPDEGKDELTSSLKAISKLAPESLTVHMLAFKRKSEISNERSLYTIAKKQVLKGMAKMTYDFANQHQYLPYYLYRQKNILGNLENIGYAKPGNECIYNILMMEEAQNVLGLGVGASSKFLIGESIHSPKDLGTYIENHESYTQRKIELLEHSLKTEAKSFIDD